MLRPTKYTDPSYSIVNIAGIIIEEIRKTESLKFDELLNKTILQTGENARHVFVYALSLLFSMGVLEFDLLTDAFYLKRLPDEAQ